MNIYKHCIQKGSHGNVFVQNRELKNRMDALIQSVNDNSVLPMPLLTSFDASKIPAGSKFIRNYMSLDYYYDDYELKFAGYPTDEDDFYLTNIEFETDVYNLFGLSTNSTKEDVVRKLTAFRFNNMPEKESRDYLCFCNLDVRIGVQLKDNIVVRMVISVATYYLGNRMY